MPTQNEFTADPDGQALMNVLIELDIAPDKAYNATQAVRDMSGREVIGRIDALEATTVGRIDALEATTAARIDALEATTAARIDALEIRMDAQSSQIDLLGWGVGATFLMVMALTAIGLINLFHSKWPQGRHGGGSHSAE